MFTYQITDFPASARKHTIHRDGSVSYWSVYQQCWRRQPATAIPDHELAAMSETDRTRTMRARSN